MTDQQDLRANARTIIDTNQYMTLGTADEAGRPWGSPVWYASALSLEPRWGERTAIKQRRREYACR
jgi:predicted pyridoxine 5'-phosphate oxidase superfamily flavin-nucleotide-binding protein